MPWPMSQDYNEAVQDPAGSFADADLKAGEVATNALGLPLPRSGNFADVYEIRGKNRSWAVKCFTRQIPGLRERYKEVSDYLKQNPLPFMVEFTYLEQGIRIRNAWYPILKMHWVEGFTLNEFVRNNLDKPKILEVLWQIWVKLAARMRSSELAHGDLQHGNVLLVPGSKASSLAVKLVDYDGMCVPSLTLLKSIELGHPNYQHPQRLREGGYGLEIDRFAHLVTCTALRGLIVGGKRLWDKYDNGDNLLFKEVDLRQPGQSALFKELWTIPDAALHDLVGTLTVAAAGPLNQVPQLADVLADGRLKLLPAAQEQATTRLLGAGAIVERPGPVLVPTPQRAAPIRGAPAPVATPTDNAWESLDEFTPIATPARPRTQTNSGFVWIAAAILGVVVVGGGLGFMLMNKNSPPDNSKLVEKPWKSHIGSKKKEEKKEEKQGEKPATPVPVPDPVLRWQFAKNAIDSIHGVEGELKGGAKVVNGWLWLDGKKASMITKPMPVDLGPRTLEVWLTVGNLAQGDSAVMQLADGRGWWDGILYATKKRGNWYPGSSFNQRSATLDGPMEDAKPGELIHLVAVYRADNSITLYRNGKIYGIPFTPSGPNSALQTYKKGDAFLIFGSNGGSLQFFTGDIAEARVYDVPLNEDEIATLFRSARPKRSSAPAEVPVGQFPTPTGDVLFLKKEELTQTDSRDRVKKTSYCKIVPQLLASKSIYCIDVTSSDFDPYVRLETQSGINVAEVAAGKGRAARIVYRTPGAGHYQIVVASNAPDQTGKYTLRLAFGRIGDLLENRGNRIAHVGPKERTQIVDEVEKELEFDKTRVTETDARLALRIVNNLQAVDAKLSAQVYQRFGAVLATATDPGARAIFKKSAEAKLPPRFTNSLGIEFALIPKGKSWLGGGGSKPGNLEVEIVNDFYLGVYEVTQKEWKLIMGNNPSAFSKVARVSQKNQERFPVEQVSWDDAQIFLSKLNQREKQPGWVYRLPKEAEWEYACRGGPMTDKAESAFHYYFEKSTNRLLPKQANFDFGKGLKRTCKVGSFKPNRLGLYDMHGNVWEWCDDEGPDPNNPKGPARRTRGGSWGSDSGGLRADRRNAVPPSTRYPDHGLRVARVPFGKEIVKIASEK
jgi:formylglycine-generating enzyme required for sulfatase activity